MPGRVSSLHGSRLEQERINVTFRWIKRHFASCPFLGTGVACCLPTFSQGSSVSGGESWGYLSILECWLSWFTPSCPQDPGYAGVPSARHGRALLVSLQIFLGFIIWHFWIGRPRKPGPRPQEVAVEVFHVGCELTHGDFALEAEVDCLAVVEHRLIPAWVRSAWSRLRG